MQDFDDLHLVFALAGDLFAVPVGQVSEVVPYERPVPVPRAPDFVGGIVNHHGRIVTLIDIARFLSVRAEWRAPPAHIVLVARDDVDLGIACERVIRIAPMSAPPSEPMVWTDEGLVLVVDLEQALTGLETFFG